MTEVDRDRLGWGIIFLIAAGAIYALANGPAHAGGKAWSTVMWGGFTEGKLDSPLVDDFWGGHNERQVPALFPTRKAATLRYEDVRRVKIIEYRRKRR